MNKLIRIHIHIYEFVKHYLFNKLASFTCFGLLCPFLVADSPANEYPPSVKALETAIKKKYDSYAVFKWDEYTMLLEKLAEKKFLVLPICEMNNTFDSSMVVVGLRHDVDLNPFKAVEMARLEQMYGIRATYYLLATAEYYGIITDKGLIRSPGIEHLIWEIHSTGAEIGIHNDLLSIQVLHNLDPLEFNKEELRYYKTLNIPVYGTASHGSPLAKQTVPNYEVFSDFSKKDSLFFRGASYPIGRHSLSHYGFLYEAYFINYGIYLSESGGKWNDPEGLKGILKRLESCKPGDRVQILVHPEWWGRFDRV